MSQATDITHHSLRGKSTQRVTCRVSTDPHNLSRSQRTVRHRCSAPATFPRTICVSRISDSAPLPDRVVSSERSSGNAVFRNTTLSAMWCSFDRLCSIGATPDSATFIQHCHNAEARSTFGSAESHRTPMFVPQSTQKCVSQHTTFKLLSRDRLEC